MSDPFNFVKVNFMKNKQIYLFFYKVERVEELNRYRNLDDQTVKNCDEVLQNFNTLPVLIKLLAILVYISIDDISRFIFKLKDSNENHQIIVIGDKNKEPKMSVDSDEKLIYYPEKHKFTFKIDDLCELFHKKIKVWWPVPNEEQEEVKDAKDVKEEEEEEEKKVILYGSAHQKYTYLITEKKNDYVFDLDSHTKTLGKVKFVKSETDSSFTIEQEIEINIYSIYVLVDILKSEVEQLKRNKKFAVCAESVSKNAVIKKLEEQLKRLEKLKQYYKATLAAVSPFRHKKSRRRGSKSVKQRRKLRSKSKSRKLSPKIFRR